MSYRGRHHKLGLFAASMDAAQHAQLAMLRAVQAAKAGLFRAKMTQHEQLPHSCRPSLVTLSAELPYSQAGLPSSCWTPTRVSPCSTAHPLPSRWAHIAALQQALPLTTSTCCVRLRCSLRPAQLHRAVRRVAAPGQDPLKALGQSCRHAFSAAAPQGSTVSRDIQGGCCGPTSL